MNTQELSRSNETHEGKAAWTKLSKRVKNLSAQESRGQDMKKFESVYTFFARQRQPNKVRY